MSEIIHINSFGGLTDEQMKALEGCYVKVPKYDVPVYIPKRDENGVAILPKDWYEPYDDDD